MPDSSVNSCLACLHKALGSVPSTADNSNKARSRVRGQVKLRRKDHPSYYTSDTIVYPTWAESSQISQKMLRTVLLVHSTDEILRLDNLFNTMQPKDEARVQGKVLDSSLNIRQYFHAAAH